MQLLEILKAQMLAISDQQISLIDPDARSRIDISTENAGGQRPIVTMGADGEAGVTPRDEGVRERALHEHSVVVGRQPVQAERLLEVAAGDRERTEGLVTRISKAFRTSGRTLATAATRHALTSLMQFTLWPTASRRTTRAMRSVRVILRTREIGNDNESILIVRLRRLGSGSKPIEKANDLPSKTQHCPRIAASALEAIEGHAKAHCCVRRNRSRSPTRPSCLRSFRFLYECDF